MSMKKIKIILLVALLGGVVWILGGGISASRERVVPKALWNAIGKNDSEIGSDSDKDGLSDEEEKKLGTDPKKADTDGDGFLDGQEVKGGYDPLRAAPGDKVLNNNVNSNSNSNNNTNSNANTNSNNNSNTNTNSQNTNSSNPTVTNSNSNTSSENSTNQNNNSNITEQVALKVDDLISRYKLYSTPYTSLDEETKAEVEKELNSFSANIIKSSGLDFAFNIPDDTLRVNDNETKDKNQYVAKAKDILRKHGLLQDNQTIEDGIKAIINDLASMGKNDIDWNKIATWKRECPLAYQELLEMPVNSELKGVHIRLLRTVRSLNIVFQNINEGDYFRSFLAAGRAEKIGDEVDKFTQEIK